MSIADEMVGKKYVENDSSFFQSKFVIVIIEKKKRINNCDISLSYSQDSMRASVVECALCS